MTHSLVHAGRVPCALRALVASVLLACPTAIRWAEASSPPTAAVGLPVLAEDHRSQLRLAERLTAHAAWDEALDIWTKLVSLDDAGVVEDKDGVGVSLREWCHRRLAALPRAGLRRYRLRVDEQAAALLNEGLRTRNTEQLQRIVDHYFCSTSGDDALMALGDMALERGDFTSARGYWERMSPQLRRADGGPWWPYLERLSPAERHTAIEDVTQSPDAASRWLAFPDTDRPLADVRACLALVSIRSGELARAAIEVDVLERLHPAAQGKLAGRNVNYVTFLKQLLATAGETGSAANMLWPREHDWRSVLGHPQRHRQLANSYDIGALLWQSKLEPCCELTAPCRHPVVADGRLFLADSRRVYAWDVATGKPAFGATAVLYEDQRADVTSQNGKSRRRVGVPRFTLTVHDSLLLARSGDPRTFFVQPGEPHRVSSILGFDLSSQGLLTFACKPARPSLAFDGVPLSDGRYVFIAVRSSDVRARVGVACYAIESGELVWQQEILAARTTSAAVDSVTHTLLTLCEDKVYVNTNLGAVAALRAKDGHICWIRRLDGSRVDESDEEFQASAYRFRDANPCVWLQGRLLVAPADNPHVYALDAVNGDVLWTSAALPHAVHLLGVTDGKLFLSGERLYSLDVSRGMASDLRHFAPGMHRSQDFGRGCVAGKRVYWPTATGLAIVEAATGLDAQRSIAWSADQTPGGNIIITDKYAVVVSGLSISVFRALRTGFDSAIEPQRRDAAI